MARADVLRQAGKARERIGCTVCEYLGRDILSDIGGLPDSDIEEGASPEIWQIACVGSARVWPKCISHDPNASAGESKGLVGLSMQSPNPDLAHLDLEEILVRFP